MRIVPDHAPGWRRAPVPEQSHDVHRAGFCVRRFSLHLALPGDAATTLLFISDLHWNKPPGTTTAEEIVAAVNAEGADWILTGGDLIRFAADLPAVTDMLGRLQARRGKLAILGNRETGNPQTSVRFWADAYARSAFLLLHNAFHLSPDGGPVFVGLDEPRHGKPELGVVADARRAGTAVVTLSHSPDTVAGSADADIGDLVLAGHTHGGQIRLPVVGALYTSSRYWQQFDRGWFRRTDGTRMFVTAGLGSTGRRPLRRRFLCPPEIVVLELHPKPPPTRSDPSSR